MSADERIRLAQELHDGIAQDLVGLGYSIDSLVAAVGTPVEIRAELRTLRFAMSDLVDKVRAEIFELRACGAAVISRSPDKTSTGFELQRIFNELLRNTQEHSQATSFTLTVQDNGLGGVTEKNGHHGLTGVRERVRDLNGVLEIKSNESGTQVSITVPLLTP